MEFLVAKTINGSSIFRVMPSTLTCRSCIHSSKADCDFGGARLISSTITKLENIGPDRNSNSLSLGL